MRFWSFCVAVVVFFVCGLSGNAQINKPINVSVKVFEPNPNIDEKAKTPYVAAPSSEVYIFDSRAKAAGFYNAQKAMMGDDTGAVMIDDNAFESHKDKVKTDNYGECEVPAVGSNWYIVACKDQSLSNVISIDGRTEISIEMISQADITLTNVDVVDKMKRQRIKTRNNAFGDTRIIQTDIAIFPEDANSTMRYGLSPFTTLANNSYAFTSEYQKRDPGTDSIFKHIRPYLIDGEDYDRTQFRKMGYDADNDPLSIYVDRTQKVKTRSADSLAFHIFEVLKPTKQDAIYPTYAYWWRENYGNLVILDTLLIHDGYANFPMRFIDFAFPEVEIDASKYARQPKRSAQEGKDMLNIEFVNGKAEVLPTDTAGLAALDKITRTLEEIARDPDGSLFGVYIHGYASPEGGRAINESLCRQRASFLQHKVMANLRGVGSDVQGSVAEWKDVADLLRADSISDPENIARAEQIEQIIASSSSQSQIDSKMQASPLYRFLKENENKYYKPLRKVEISYQYTLNKVLSREEVIKRYEAKEDLLYPYQYQYLFDYLEDRPKELEQVAKKVMKMPNANEPTGKPWTLAAYYLAKSYTARDTCDVSLLDPYITIDGEKCRKERPGSFLRRAEGCSTYLNAEHISNDGSRIQYMNDEGIVMMQISMLVKAGKIFEAFKLSDNLLPDNDPRFHQPKTVLECMDGSWTVPSVRETVAATSPWNKVVVYAAQDEDPTMDEAYWEDAWNLLNDSTVFHLDTPRELYMKAVLARRLYATAKNWNNRKDEVPVPVQYFDIGENTIFSHPSFTDDAYPWGAVMIKACEIDPSFINTLKFDGEFNQNYRDGFAKHWNEIHPDKILK